MKKIDIITLHNVRNYGSVLQTYATQKIFEKLGLEVEVIDFYRKDQIKENVIENRVRESSVFSKNVVTKLIGGLILKNNIEKQDKIFNEFLKNRIRLTKDKYFSYEDLKKNCPDADIFCTGSDQVWNSDWNKGIEKSFFLDFINDNKKRISFAASFGKNKLDDNEIEETKKMLEKYDSISVREKSAVDIIKELGIQSVEQVLDPTLLLTKEEWENLATKKKERKKYILVYQLNSNNKEFDTYVKGFAKYKNMNVIRISVANYQILKYGKLVVCPPVEEFLRYFVNAEYVITDSFHATGFSINLNKKFVCIYPPKFSTRLQSILELTGLENRKVSKINDFEIADYPIDYKKVNTILKEERRKTEEFLKSAINSK